MSDAVVDDIVAVLPPLLQSLEALEFIARHLNPPDFDRVMQAAGTPDEALRAVRPRLAQWPDQFAAIQNALATASDAALAAFAGLREVENGNGDLMSVFRALRHAPRAQEALYPLARKLPPVGQFFVERGLFRLPCSQLAIELFALLHQRPAFRQQRLTDGVVDLVRAGVVQVFALEKDARAAQLTAPTLSETQRRWTTDIMR